MLTASCVLREIPTETNRSTGGRDASIALAISSFKYSCLYLFHRAVALLEGLSRRGEGEGGPCLTQSDAMTAIVSCLLGSLETLVVWADSTIGREGCADEVRGRAWLEAEHLCSCAVQVDRHDCEGGESSYSVSVLEGGAAWEGSVIQLLSGTVMPLLLSALGADGLAATHPELQDMLDKCLCAGMELMLFFLQCAPAPTTDELQGTSAEFQFIVKTSVAAVYHTMLAVAGFLVDCDLDGTGQPLTLGTLRGELQNIQVGEAYCVSTAMTNTQTICDAIRSRLNRLRGEEGDCMNGQCGLEIVAMHFVECVICLADRHLVRDVVDNL